MGEFWFGNILITSMSFKSLDLYFIMVFEAITFGILMFWAIDPKIIEILNSNFSNFKKRMLMWKIIRSLCTLCLMGFLYPICPSLSSRSVSTSEKARKEYRKKKTISYPTPYQNRKANKTKSIYLLHLPWTLNLETKP